MRKLLHLAVILFIFGLNFGCTRSIKDDAKVSIVIPTSQKVGAMSIPAGFQLGHIVVNVHGPQLRIFTWDGKCGDGCTATPPAAITMDVPSGNNRVIQYLGVYENNDTGAMIMYYGDKVANLTGGDVTVSIDISQHGNISAGQANISGQYVTSFDGVANVGRGPTGRLETVFKPSTTAPPMVIEPVEMFNGWIHAFALKGIQLQYRFPNGEYLKDGGGIPITFDRLSTQSDLAGDNLVRYVAPNEFWVQDGGGSGRRKQNGGEAIMGFFGPAAVPGAKACYGPNGSVSSLWDADTGGSNLTHCGVGCSSEAIQRISTSGVALASCSDANMLRTEVAYKADQLGNGKNSVAQFRGPFAKKTWSSTPMITPCSGMTPSGYMFTQSCYQHPTGGGIRWNYIPEVFTGANAITGVAIFHKVFLPACNNGDSPCANEYRVKNGDGYDCANLAAKGFTKSADFLPATTPELIFNGALPEGSNRVAIACPFRDEGGVRRYFSSGVEFHDMRAPLPALSGVSVRNAADTVADSYLVDASLTSNPISAHFSAFAGASSYTAEIRQMGSPVCSEESGSVSPITFPSCHTDIESTPGNYELVVTAKNASGDAIAMSSHNFTYLNDPPVITSVTMSICTDWNTTANVQLNGTVFATSGASTIDWYTSWTGTQNGTNSGNFAFTPTSVPLVAQTGMLTAVSNSYTVNLSLTPVHASGYVGPAYPITAFTVTDGACSP